jgi:hypothetical protein
MNIQMNEFHGIGIHDSWCVRLQGPMSHLVFLTFTSSKWVVWNLKKIFSSIFENLVVNCIILYYSMKVDDIGKTYFLMF